MQLHSTFTCILTAILAYSYITMTGASLNGAAISLHAAVTLTNSAVRLPGTRAGVTLTSGPSYSFAVDMMGASSFAVLGSTQITNTVR